MKMPLRKNKVLILGSSGLIGNTIAKYLAQMNCDLSLSISDKTNVKIVNILKNISNVIKFDALHYDKININLDIINPDIIINCIGVTKHVLKDYRPTDTYFLNSIFPNLLSNWCNKNSKRLIHISSDCIFDGTKPKSRIIDEDIYGYSKYLGEKNINNGLIIRTSTVGHELNSSYGLLNWFMGQNTEVKGYTNAFFNGITTLTLAMYIYKILNKIPNEKLILNLTSKKISKYDLINIFNILYKCNKSIIPINTPKIDRTLSANKDEKLVFIRKSWFQQIVETRNFNIKK